MQTSKSAMLSTIKKVTLFTLLLVLLMTPSTVYAKKKKSSTNKKVTKITTEITNGTGAKKVFKWRKDKKKLYAMDNIIIYSHPKTTSRKISTYITNQIIKVISSSTDGKWYKVKYSGRTRYILAKDTSKKKNKKYTYKGKRLTRSAGICYGPSGKESYYNLPMSGVISSMRSRGYKASKYPYWVRDDGAKMLGKYVMIAANLSVRPKGTLVKTSLGTAIVCDTGGFARYTKTGIDIATAW
jgi:hypothetical protein